MTGNDYQSGVADVLNAMGITLRWGGTITERSIASKAGRNLADEFLLDGVNGAVDEFLGSPWSEMAKPYPQKVGLALIAKGLDPDQEELRLELLRGLHGRLRDRAADTPSA